jgi:hypothetical protein
MLISFVNYVEKNMLLNLNIASTIWTLEASTSLHFFHDRTYKKLNAIAKLG